jgi:uncharacterized protein YkwD
MREIFLGLLASMTLIGASPVEPAAYEALVVPAPSAVVVRADEEHALILDVNLIRTREGLPRVEVDEQLAKAARMHADDMAQRKYFGHNSPDGNSLPDRLAAVGFRWSVAAENIAFDEDEAHANSALLHSADHRANILDPRVRKIGVAVLGVGAGASLYVEDFAAL